MRKALLAVAILAGALFIYRRLRAARAEEDLWIEATRAEPVGAE
ncbi:MAG: DLW-39 family protein [Acidothermus cellulolyticus]|nr:DLW-39 family protein [Acidothermus cellulolyticus]